ncbi:MAG: amino acid permease [Acidobacteriota bacterium]
MNNRLSPFSESPSGSQADRDAQELSRLGYAQELFRTMGGFSNFAVSFSIISILTGAVTLFGYGFEMGGPLQMTLGWPLVALFSLFVALGMAELSSAFPTSGAMYHWASALGGKGWGWTSALLNLVALITAVAGIDYGCAQFLAPLLGISSTKMNLLWLYGLILFSHALINHFGIRWVAFLNDASVTIHVVGVAVVVAALAFFAPHQPASFLLQPINSNGRDYTWAFILGLLQAQWTFTGFDASAHLAEETHDPRRRVPWGIVMSVLVSAVIGYILLLGLVLAIGNIPAILGATDRSGEPVPAVVAILQQALGSRAGAAMSAIAMLAMWFCGLSCVTSCSRTVYAFARDHGLPGSSLWKRVSPTHGTPDAAVWGTVVAAFVALVYSGAYSVVTSISALTFYLSYLIPIFLGLRSPGWQRDAPWNLGRYSRVVACLGLGWGCFILVVLVLPPNQLAGKTLAALAIVLAGLYFGWVRQRYDGPAWAREYLAGIKTNVGQAEYEQA